MTPIKISEAVTSEEEEEAELVSEVWVEVCSVKTVEAGVLQIAASVPDQTEAQEQGSGPRQCWVCEEEAARESDHGRSLEVHQPSSAPGCVVGECPPDAAGCDSDFPTSGWDFLKTLGYCSEMKEQVEPAQMVCLEGRDPLYCGELESEQN